MQNKEVWLFPQNSCSMKQFFITLNVFGKLNGISRKENIQQLLMVRVILQIVPLRLLQKVTKMV